MHTLHPSTFEFLTPTDKQKADMARLRIASAIYADSIEKFAPSGPDKTYALRKLREIAMWLNVSVTRHADGSPRAGDEPVSTAAEPVGFTTNAINDYD